MCQGHFSGFLHHFLLTKLATSSILMLLLKLSIEPCTGSRNVKQTCCGLDLLALVRTYSRVFHKQGCQLRHLNPYAASG